MSHRGPGVRVTIKDAHSQSHASCDYLLLALPATTLRRIPMTPSLPAQQHDAIAALKYGRATKTLLQFSRPFWRVAAVRAPSDRRCRFGAVWDGNEEQRGRPGILTLLAGGGASDETQALVAKDGPTGLVRALDWLGSKDRRSLASRQIVWEDDPYARGGYAYFDPAFDPDLRAWLSRPAGRLFFAGEHTSIRWQGYMNGAVESGRRAAAEIAAESLPPIRRLARPNRRLAAMPTTTADGPAERRPARPRDRRADPDREHRQPDDRRGHLRAAGVRRRRPRTGRAGGLSSSARC